MPLKHVIDALATIRTAVQRAKAPAIMCSFGKDSLALVELCSRFGVRRVLYIEDRDEVIDEDHKNAIIERYDLDVMQLPSGRGIFYTIGGKPHLLGIVGIAPNAVIHVPTNVDPYVDGEPFMCMDDRLAAVHGEMPQEPVDCLFIGFKHVDWDNNTCRMYVDALPREMRETFLAKAVPTTAYWQAAPDMAVCAPLLHWSHDDVWEFLERNHIQASPMMYHPDHSKKPYEHRVCYRCHDDAGTQIVWCPKDRMSIMNLGSSATGRLGLLALQRAGVLTEEEARVLLET